MKTLNLIKSVLLLVFISTSFLSKAEVVSHPFVTNNVQEALNKARVEGKLVFLDFSAKWCTPCLYMEETTFKDNRVANKLSDRYIAVKVDVDKSMGKQVKKEFGVKYLPTMLIIDANGSTLKKIEQTITADELFSVLQTYENTTTGYSTTRKVINTNHVEDEFSISREEYLNYSRMEEKRSNYRVQVGLYKEFSDASARSRELKEIFIDPIVILQDTQNGQKMYKVLLGNFASLDEAESFRKILKDQFNIQAIIK